MLRRYHQQLGHVNYENTFIMTLKGFINMYREGFRNMTVGKSLWVLVLIKLFILFFVIKLFFFPNILKEAADTDAQRAELVRNNLTP